jgi:hypothetical protein
MLQNYKIRLKMSAGLPFSQPLLSMHKKREWWGDGVMRKKPNTPILLEKFYQSRPGTSLHILEMGSSISLLNPVKSIERL